MTSMNMIQQIISKREGNIILVFIISLLVWFPFFYNYWAQDDFWIVADSRDFTLQKLITGTNSGFLRPVSTFWYPFALKTIFGENPFVYHLINGIISGCTSVVVYLIAYQLVKNKHVSLIAGLIYGTHFAHMFEESWFAGAQDILSSFFFATTILFFLIAIEKKNNLYYVISLATSVLAIFSKESTIILPIIFLLYLILKRYPIKKILLFPIPYFVIMISFGLIWFNLRHIAETSTYQLFFDFSIARNLTIYLYWLAYPLFILVDSIFGGLSDYYFFKAIGNYTGFIFLIFLAVFVPIYIRKILQIKIASKNVINFTLISGFISIGPAIFTTQHLYAYYLDLSLVSFSIFASIIAVHIIKKLNINLYSQIIVFVLLILLIQYANFQVIDHPAFENPLFKEGRDSKQYSQLVTQSVGSVLGPKNVIYVINYSNYEYAGVMSHGSLFRYLFPNSSIGVISLNNTQQIPKNCDSECIIITKGHELSPVVIKKIQ